MFNKSVFWLWVFIFCPSLIAWSDTIYPLETKKMLEATGGRILVPGSYKGCINYVNCQKKAKSEWLNEHIEYIKAATRFNVALTEGEFEFPKPKIIGNASIFIVDINYYPTLICSPEDNWVLINVSHLFDKRESFFAARVKKELSRGFAYLCGACNSQYPGTIMSAVKNTTDLDKHIDYKLPIDILSRFPRYMKYSGVIPKYLTTYKAACKQGWAPAPTNEYQKAIWDKVRSEKERGPTNPIEIPMPKKK